MTPARCTAVLALGSVLACAEPADAPSSVEAVAGDVAFDPNPALEIGREGDPDYEFSDIVAFGRLASGRWYILDRGSSDVRIYDSAGLLLDRIGRRGEGPGEFQYLYGAFARPGDELVVQDAMLRRLTRLSADGEVEGIAALPAQPPGLWSVLDPIGWLEGLGPVWSSVLTPPCVDKLVSRDTVAYFHADSESGNLVEIARVPGGLRWGTSTNVLRRCLPTPVPFAGPPIAAARGSRLVIARRDVREVRVIDVDSGESFVLDGAAERVALTPTMIEAWIEDRMSRTFRDERGRPLPNALGVAEYEQRLREVTYPDSLPAVGQLVVDGAGRIWVGAFDVPGASSVAWSVVSADGSQRQALTLPPGYRVMEIGSDYLAAVATDSFDVQRAVVHALRAAGR